MPPSPSLRYSPGKELPGKQHRRGHSIEYGILYRDKDDDLALFSELQDKERDDFLLHPSHGLEDAFSTKLKHFSEFTIPLQGESSRLLSAEGEKNDYDWLLTPPDTPLFPSLDDEPPPASVGRRGRPQSQISLSRSSTMEKRRRSSRGSASPNRFSTSPRSDNLHQIRGRTSSAPHPSPASGQRSATPVRRISPTPGKPLGLVSRSLTPTSRRMSTGSTTLASTAVRGTSPVLSSRGNSASPKINVWQSNIPGFSLDAPPNLRTSLGDRPTSYVRGSSPASRNGRDASSTRRRQSVSPSASRSVSSSHSHERDRFSSHSKGSVASSGEDDLHSLQSIPVGSSERVVSKRASLSPNSRTSRSSKLLSPCSAPRRPFESALRQMDHPKSHPSMFRPLASSLPSTSIYSGKGSSSYHHIMLRHSSPTVGNSSSSGQVTEFMPNTKGSDPIPVIQSDVENLGYPDNLGKTSVFGMVDESRGSSFSNQLDDINQGYVVESESSVNEEVNHHVSDVENSSTHGSLLVGKDFFEEVVLETMEVCGRCGSDYRVTQATRSEINICPDCREENNSVVTDSPGTAEALNEIPKKQSQKFFDENNSFVEEAENIKQCDDSYDQEQDNLHESSISRALEEQDAETLYHQDEIQSSGGRGLFSTSSNDTQTQISDEHNDVKIGSSEGRGLPLLIKRSVSMKSPVIQVNNSSYFTRSYDGFSYLGDRSISLRSSTETTSASSSWDYGSSIRKGSHVRHQSGSTLDMETRKYDTNSKSLSSMSSSSGVSSHTCQALNVIPADSFEVCSALTTCTHDETHQKSHPQLQDSECKETNKMSVDFSESDVSIGLSISVVDAVENRNRVIIDNEFCESGDDVANTMMSKGEISESPAHVRGKSELGASPVTDDCSLYDHPTLQEDGNETLHHGSSTMTASEIEPGSCEPETPGLGVHNEIPESECNLNTIYDCLEKRMSDVSVDHHNSLAPVNEILDESTVFVECPGRKETKSLTLEEATDTILLCSSIVHDIVYQAATIAIDKAKDMPPEEEMLHPTVTVLGKSNANTSSYARGGGKKAKKQSSKSAKASRKQKTETEEKREVHVENDENKGEAAMIGNFGVPSSKGVNMKAPPKLENKCNCSIM